MPSECPLRRWRSVRLWADQMITLLSKEADAKRFPSFENFTQDTARVCPVRVFRCRYGLYVVWFVGVVPLLDMLLICLPQSLPAFLPSFLPLGFISVSPHGLLLLLKLRPNHSQCHFFFSSSLHYPNLYSFFFFNFFLYN